MSKAFSNRALPPGTVLREWRLEDVLGVGGFGIVYKGRGIYFDELVAIKEYFPSATSERAEDETVVPVDSNAEEVHALGLKKFVEEAKLLWNLSTPTRHPNIVSVRSLFEIHGTAYMVMDFEDGTPLNRLLKNGVKFNEASLKKMIVPICEGLERAHRVGVLHRDIKPPNIMVGDDGRSVLIDFGSARFESGEATSTTVTFHTPPYAAIEQYVRTYPQGPWTDIYALGVVLYECITGAKPAEVLERVHGEAGEKLVDGKYPGFSRKFLAAVDAAMALRPEDRPQSIGEWLKQLKDDESTAAAGDDGDDEEDDVTRIGGWESGNAAIAATGAGAADRKLDTGVPETVSKAEFVSREDKPAPAEEPPKTAAPKPEADKKPEPEKKPEPAKPIPAATDAGEKLADKSPPPPVAAKTKKPPVDKPAGGKSKSKLPLLAGAAIAALIVGGAWFVFSGSSPQEVAVIEEPIDATGDPRAILAQLTQQAQGAGIAPELLAPLVLPEPADGAAAPAGVADDEGTEAAPEIEEADLKVMLANFANGVTADAERRLRALSSGNAPNVRAGIAPLREQLDQLKAGAEDIFAATDQAAAVSATSAFISGVQGFNGAVLALREGTPGATPTGLASAAVPGAPVPPGATAAAIPVAASAPDEPSGPAAPVSSATRSEFERAMNESRSLVEQVVRLSRQSRPGSRATDEEKAAYELRQTNADLARQYDDYLDQLEASMPGITSDVAAAQQVTNTYQTRGYLRDLVRQSQQSLP